jgi:hypothetical protein
MPSSSSHQKDACHFYPGALASINQKADITNFPIGHRITDTRLWHHSKYFSFSARASGGFLTEVLGFTKDIQLKMWQYDFENHSQLNLSPAHLPRL